MPTETAILEALQRLVDAASDGQITAGELARQPIKTIRRELKEWLRASDGQVLATVDPRVALLADAGLDVARGGDFDLVTFLRELLASPGLGLDPKVEAFLRLVLEFADDGELDLLDLAIALRAAGII